MASVLYSPEQIHNIFPNLGQHPEEGAFLLTAHDVLPQGMLGLLIAGIFGATLSSLDASVNQGVGILVRNFYLPVVNPQCSEKKLLIISKCSTAMFGVVIIGIGLVVSKLRTLPLFDLVNQLGVSLWLPLAIPMCLGLFYKRTPAWSSWTTVLIGLAMSFLASFGIKPANVIDLQSFQEMCRPGLRICTSAADHFKPRHLDPWNGGPFKPEEVTQFYPLRHRGGRQHRVRRLVFLHVAVL